MSGLTFLPITNELSFRLSRGPALRFGPAADAEVTRLWESGAAQGLTDGVILCVLTMGDIVELSPVHYRYWWAQKVKPGLFAEPLKSLAVSGLTWCEDRLVLGSRAAWVTQDPECLEFVPSGSVDADDEDLFGQIDREMTEELGIARDVITAHRVIGLVDDPVNHVVDVVIETTLTCTFADVLQAHARLERPEYTELHALTPAELRQAIDRDPTSAVSRTIFAHAVQEA